MLGNIVCLSGRRCRWRNLLVVVHPWLSLRLWRDLLWLNAKRILLRGQLGNTFFLSKLFQNRLDTIKLVLQRVNRGLGQLFNLRIDVRVERPIRADGGGILVDLLDLSQQVFALLLSGQILGGHILSVLRGLLVLTFLGQPVCFLSTEALKFFLLGCGRCWCTATYGQVQQPLGQPANGSTVCRRLAHLFNNFLLRFVDAFGDQVLCCL